MKKIMTAIVIVLFMAMSAFAQISEKTGPAAAEIKEGDSVSQSSPVLLKKYNTPEQRKSAAEEKQDSTVRPQSRMGKMMQPSETPTMFPVK